MSMRSLAFFMTFARYWLKMTTIYNQIGHHYNRSRKADPFLVSRMYNGLHCGSDKIYLDIGCGTGNYTRELQVLGLEMVGVDPSIVMLQQAKSKYPEMKWIEGSAEKIPMRDHSIDAALGSLTLHHWDSISKGFRELKRVLKPNGRMVFFTALPSQMECYWLAHYFPKMILDSANKMPSWDIICQAALNTGWKIQATEKYYIQDSLKDLFLYAGKNNPAFYLNEANRNGISSFTTLADSEEVEKGLDLLRRDIESGRIEQIIKKYDSDSGDYIFISFS